MSSESSDMELHSSSIYWLGRLATQMQESFNGVVAEHDVSWAQWMVLNAVYFEKAKTPAQIAQHIGVDRSAITRLVDRLESKGLVIRSRENADRRSINIELTTKGRNLIPTLLDSAKTQEKQFIELLNDNEQKNFFRGLSVLLSATGNEDNPFH